MSDWLRSSFFSMPFVKYQLWHSQTLITLLAVVGAAWTLIEVSTFFEPCIGVWIRDSLGLVLFLVATLLITAFFRRARTVVIRSLDGRDVKICVKVGDILSEKASCVIPTNTTFDTKVPEIISPKSTQGSFTRRFYDAVEYLDADIEGGLTGIEFKDISSDVGRQGKTKRFPMGTVVEVSPKSRKFYLLAMADMSAKGAAKSSLECVSASLVGLWAHFGTAGNYEEELVIPVIGSGRGRLSETREEIIREMIDSFVVANSEAKVCEKLTIVVFEEDFWQHGISMHDIEEYLDYVCKFHNHARPPESASGVGLGLDSGIAT